MDRTIRRRDDEDFTDPAAQLLRIVQALAAVLHSSRPATATLDSRLARELGFDSLAPPLEPLSIVTPVADELASMPVAAQTLVEVLQWQVVLHTERVRILFAVRRGRARSSHNASCERTPCGSRRNFSGVWWRRARVALMLLTGTEYFFSIFGILLLGAILVPLYPPGRPFPWQIIGIMSSVLWVMAGSITCDVVVLSRSYRAIIGKK